MDVHVWFKHAVRSGGDSLPIRSFLAILAFSSFSIWGSAQRYEVVSSIPFSGNQTYWDYLLADASTHKLYVTRGNEVLILDLDSGKLLASIANLKRVHGVALAREFNRGFITDGGDNVVVVFDLASKIGRA